jgi:alpha-beta hydrolase superfamily lysophospholipase
MKLFPFFSARSRWIATLVAVFLLGGCAYLETKQGEWIFNPVQGEWRGYRGPPAEFQQHWIPVGRHDEKLHAWWVPVADPNAPVLLYLHGARWNLSGSATRITRWNRMGFSVLAIDYRGFGKSLAVDGTAPSEPRANEDAEAAWIYLATLAPRSKRFIFGHSLGGSMATHLALKYPDAAGLILEASFTSIPDMISETRFGFLPVGFLVTQRFDVIDRIDNVAMPVLVAHGTADEIVPFSMGERLFAAVKAPKRLFRAEGGTHHNLTANFFDNYRQAVFEFFKLNEQREATPSGRLPALQQSATSTTAIGPVSR